VRAFSALGFGRSNSFIYGTSLLTETKAVKRLTYQDFDIFFFDPRWKGTLGRFDVGFVEKARAEEFFKAGFVVREAVRKLEGYKELDM
jgi:hypothetical protein